MGFIDDVKFAEVREIIGSIRADRVEREIRRVLYNSGYWAYVRGIDKAPPFRDPGMCLEWRNGWRYGQASHSDRDPEAAGKRWLRECSHKLGGGS